MGRREQLAYRRMIAPLVATLNPTLVYGPSNAWLVAPELRGNEMTQHRAFWCAGGCTPRRMEEKGAGSGGFLFKFSLLHSFANRVAATSIASTADISTLDAWCSRIDDAQAPFGKAKEGIRRGLWAIPESSRMNADDRFPLEPLGRV